MELNYAERLLVNNSARALVQRYYEAPLLHKLGGSVQGLRVLDVGCGRGVGVQLLLEQFGAAHVWGIDLDAHQIERAKKRLAIKFSGRFTLGVGIVEKLPFEDATFDAVFDFGMLHHVPVWQQGISEIRRVLRPGGRLFYEEVTRKALESWLYRTFLEHPSENRFSKTDFTTELTRQGFDLTCEPQHTFFGDIFIGVAQLEDLWDDVVAMPARLPRDRETTCRALSALRPPQVKQDGPTREGMGHVSAFAFLKVHLPCRMVWVRGSLYLGV